MGMGSDTSQNIGDQTGIVVLVKLEAKLEKHAISQVAHSTH
jgi:hypothetical protein